MRPDPRRGALQPLLRRRAARRRGRSKIPSVAVVHAIFTGLAQILNQLPVSNRTNMDSHSIFWASLQILAQPWLIPAFR
jgi:hypothetical protein